jgi:hypothetical protein
MKRLLRKISYDFNYRSCPIAYINGEVLIGDDMDTHSTLVINYQREHPENKKNESLMPVGFGHIMKENGKVIAVFETNTIYHVDFNEIANAVKQQCPQIQEVCTHGG